MRDHERPLLAGLAGNCLMLRFVNLNVAFSFVSTLKFVFQLANCISSRHDKSTTPISVSSDISSSLAAVVRPSLAMALARIF